MAIPVNQLYRGNLSSLLVGFKLGLCRCSGLNPVLHHRYSWILSIFPSSQLVTTPGKVICGTYEN